jgi:preprotein translocase SecE subunit
MANNETKIEKKKAPGRIKRFFSWIRRKFKELKSEWKKISWASPKATFKNFALVLVIVICFAVVIGVIDAITRRGVLGVNELCNQIMPGIISK